MPPHTTTSTSIPTPTPTPTPATSTDVATSHNTNTPTTSEQPNTFTKTCYLHRVRYSLNEIMIYKITRSCPYVVKYKGSCMKTVTVPTFDLVVELYLERCEMDLCQWRNTAYDPSMLPIIRHDIAEAIYYLHTSDIAHLDIKPDNVLVRRNPDGSVAILLCDLEHACYISHKISTRGFIAITGTNTYNPPENNIPVVRDLRKIDIYMFALLLRALERGFVPWEFTFDRSMQNNLCILLYHEKSNPNRDEENIKALRRVFRTLFCKMETKNAITDCIDCMNDFDPDERPLIDEVRHIFAAADNMTIAEPGPSFNNPVTIMNAASAEYITDTLERLLNSSDSDRLVSVVWLFSNIDFETIAASPRLIAFIDTLCALSLNDPWASIVLFEFLHSYSATYGATVSQDVVQFIRDVRLPVDCTTIKEHVIKRIHLAQAPTLAA